MKFSERLAEWAANAKNSREVVAFLCFLLVAAFLSGAFLTETWRKVKMTPHVAEIARDTANVALRETVRLEAEHEEMRRGLSRINTLETEIEEWTASQRMNTRLVREIVCHVRAQARGENTDHCAFGGTN